MATKQSYDTRKALLDYYVYAPLGAGSLLIEKGKELGTRAVGLAKHRREVAFEAYREMAQRGEKLATSIRRSAYTKRALDQVKTARSQVKAASTSVRKAAGTSATATKQAARKVG
jgi:hypothetical protein